MARKRTAQQIDAEIAKLQAEREKVAQAEKAGVIARIKPAIEVYGITAADLGLDTGAAKARAKASKPARQPRKAGATPTLEKWKDDAGRTWSGRGPKPRWLTEALASGKTEDELRA